MSLKTLGVAALLARAGAAVPLAHNADASTTKITIPAFSPILADVGDPQASCGCLVGMDADGGSA